MKKGSATLAGIFLVAFMALTLSLIVEDSNITVNGNVNVSGTGKFILEESEFRINTTIGANDLIVNDTANLTIISSYMTNETLSYQVEIYDSASADILHSDFSSEVGVLLTGDSINYIYNSLASH